MLSTLSTFARAIPHLTCYSLFRACYFLFRTCYSVFYTCYSIFCTCYSSFRTCYFLFCTCYSFFHMCYSLLGPVHTYPEIFVSANFFKRIHLASTRVRRIRSVYPEISVYALQSGNFCIRCVSGYVWTLVSVYFCIR